MARTRNGCEWVTTSVEPGTPDTAAPINITIQSTTPMTRPMPTDSTGASSRAQAAFDSTIWASVIGIDFQNRMLRSRRSSYSEPRA